MKQIIRRLGRLACLTWLCFGMTAYAFAADEIGMVMNMEGSMTARGADGALRALKIFSKVLPGDTLFTAKDSYARVKFADGAQISLQPGAQFKIEDYHFDAQQPDKDRAGFNLVKGGLRAVSGLIGKRGDQDSYSVKAQTATVGIRGTHFGMLLCKGDYCASISTPAGKPPEEGLHLDVEEGAVVLRNAGTTQLVNAGQFGFVKDTAATPVIVPPEYGIKVDIPAKIFLDRVRGVSGEKNRSEGKNEGKSDRKDAAGTKSAGAKSDKSDAAGSGEAESDTTESDVTESGDAEPDTTEPGEAGSGGAEPDAVVCPI